MTTRSIPPARRAATALVLAGAGLGIGLAGSAPAWAAATVPCGTPAHPALYSTTHHDAVPAVTHEVKVVDQAYVPAQAAVPEVSHTELTWVDGEGTPAGDGWSPTGQTSVVEDTAAYTEYSWTRTVVDRAGSPARAAVPAVTHDETVDEEAWDETVVDSAAEPAVDEVSHLETVVDEEAYDETVVTAGGYAYQQKQTGKLKYQDTPSWNGEDNDHGLDLGWSRAPEFDITHVVHHDAVTHTIKVTDSPAVPAKPELSHVVHHDATTNTVTVVDEPAIEAVDAVEELSHVETVWTRDDSTAPEGEGWSLTGQERTQGATTHVSHEFGRTVVDEAAVPGVDEVPEVSHLEIVIDAPEVAPWDERVLVSEATPAGPACPPKPEVKTAVLDATAPSAVSADPAAVPTSAQTLAHTGSDLALPVGAGLVLVLVGGAFVVAGRRNHA